MARYGNYYNKDPWTDGPKQRPPDLEANLRKLGKRLIELLGSQFSRPGRQPPPNEWIKRLGSTGLVVLAVLIIGLWLLSGILIVNPAETAVITRFGKYVKTLGPGPHWIARSIETAYVVNEQKISTYSYEAEMLTKDENIVSVAIAVQYRINNAHHYLFATTQPLQSLQQATASALRQVIGHTNLEQVLTTGREQIRWAVQTQLSAILSKYQTGLFITDIAMQPAKAPEEVKEAFDDAIKAQEDEQRFENQARTYSMQVEPIAKGQAQRLLADAKAYQQQVVLHAQAEVTRFLAILSEYKRAPVLTRRRLYLQTLEVIMSQNNKLLIDPSANSPLLYVPLEKLLTKNQSHTKLATLPQTSTSDTVHSKTVADTSGGYE